MPSQTCFVISPVGDPGTDTDKRADQLFRYVIEPVVSGLGYATKRTVEMRLPGTITSQVLAAVADSDLVVADLTDGDASVFYELAIRHAAQRPVVQLIDAAQRPPFDLADVRTIYIDVHDLDSAEEAREQLKREIEAAVTALVETPVAAARSMKALWESEEPAAPVLAEALSEIRALEQERIRREGRSPGPDGRERAGGQMDPTSAAGQLSLPGQPLFPGRSLFPAMPSALEHDPVVAVPAEPTAGNHDGKPGRGSENGKSARGSGNHDGKSSAGAKSRKARKHRD